MKTIFKFIAAAALVFGGCLFIVQAQTTGLSYSSNARAEIIKAVADAKVTHQRVIIEIGSNGCVWCARLHKFIDGDPEIRRVAATFITVRADFQSNVVLLNSFAEVTGTPHFFVLDERGRLLTSQETDSLESGDSYDRDLLLDFYRSWAVRPAVKRAPKKAAKRLSRAK